MNAVNTAQPNINPALKGKTDAPKSDQSVNGGGKAADVGAGAGSSKAAGQKVGGRDNEVSEYLKMISRLENSVKKDEVKEADVDKVLEALDDRIDTLSKSEKKKLEQISSFKKLEVEELDTMKDSLAKLFEDDKGRDKVFDFLKAPEFISLLSNEQKNSGGTYSPTGMAGGNRASNAV